MNYWLLKSEPSAFSLTDLQNSPQRTTCWDGVRNYQARNFLRDDVENGDLAFFYHSGCAEPAVVGIVSVVSGAYPDHTAFDPDDKHYDAASDVANPRWFMVDVRFERALENPLTLRELKLYKDKRLAGLTLLQRGNRLSVLPVRKDHWEFIISLEQQKRVD
jgi:predicted RNA-binding protein with PUA-like domain